MAVSVGLKSINFHEWFRMSIATVYAEQIPSTIEYLCKALEMTDPWVKFMFDQMRSRALMLNRLDTDDVIVAEST